MKVLFSGDLLQNDSVFISERNRIETQLSSIERTIEFKFPGSDLYEEHKNKFDFVRDVSLRHQLENDYFQMLIYKQLNDFTFSCIYAFFVIEQLLKYNCEETLNEIFFQTYFKFKGNKESIIEDKLNIYSDKLLGNNRVNRFNNSVFNIKYVRDSALHGDHLRTMNYEMRLLRDEQKIIKNYNDLYEVEGKAPRPEQTDAFKKSSRDKNNIRSVKFKHSRNLVSVLNTVDQSILYFQV